MDTILKTVFVYAFLWAVVRLAGRRTVKEATAFDFVLFMLIGSAMQRALTGQDYSLTNAVLIVSTLVLLDVLLSLGRRDWTMFGKILKGVSTIVVEDGKPLTWRLRRARLKEDDVVDAGRSRHGLDHIDEIKFAILEASGEISIIPYEKSPRGGRAKGPGRDD